MTTTSALDTRTAGFGTAGFGTSGFGDGLAGLDAAFLRRTVRTTLMLGVVLTAWLVQTLHMPALGGFAAGVLIGVGGLCATMWTVGFAKDRGPGRFRTWVPVAIGFVKFGLVYWSFRVLVWKFLFSPVAIAAGTSLVIVVIVLKTVGQLLLLVDRTGRK